MTTDVPAAKEFYGKLFGWKAEDMPMEGFTYTIFKVGDRMVGGMGPMMCEESKGVPPCWKSYVTVADIDETARKAAELGGKVLVPPQDIPEVGRFAIFQDPQGAVISAITYV